MNTALEAIQLALQEIHAKSNIFHSSQHIVDDKANEFGITSLKISQALEYKQDESEMQLIMTLSRNVNVLYEYVLAYEAMPLMERVFNKSKVLRNIVALDSQIGMLNEAVDSELNDQAKNEVDRIIGLENEVLDVMDNLHVLTTQGSETVPIFISMWCSLTYEQRVTAHGILQELADENINTIISFGIIKYCCDIISNVDEYVAEYRVHALELLIWMTEIHQTKDIIRKTPKFSSVVEAITSPETEVSYTAITLVRAMCVRNEINKIFFASQNVIGILLNLIRSPACDRKLRYASIGALASLAIPTENCHYFSSEAIADLVVLIHHIPDNEARGIASILRLLNVVDIDMDTP